MSKKKITKKDREIINKANDIMPYLDFKIVKLDEKQWKKQLD